MRGDRAGGQEQTRCAPRSAAAAPDQTVQFAVLGYAITSMETETYRRGSSTRSRDRYAAGRDRSLTPSGRPG